MVMSDQIFFYQTRSQADYFWLRVFLFLTYVIDVLWETKRSFPNACMVFVTCGGDVDDKWRRLYQTWNQNRWTASCVFPHMYDLFDRRRREELLSTWARNNKDAIIMSNVLQLIVIKRCLGAKLDYMSSQKLDVLGFIAARSDSSTPKYDTHKIWPFENMNKVVLMWY